MTDKERILTYIISRLSYVATRYGDGYSAKMNDDDVYFQYLKGNNANELQVNDIVFCQTSGIHDFTVGYVVSIDGYSEITIRDIASERTCKIQNDSFLILKNLSEEQLLYGEEWIMRNKIIKAFARGDEWLYRFGGVKFEADIAHIKIRERHALKKREPFVISIKWHKNTTIKAILQAMRDGGYGSKWEDEQSFNPL